MKFVSDIFEKSIEIFLQKSVLIANNVSPLDHHVVQSDVNIIEFSKAV